MARASTQMRGLYIDGKWIEGSDTHQVDDLSKDTTLAEITVAGPAEIETALSAAHNVKRRMRKTTVVERTNWLEQIAQGIEDRQEELAETIVREAGKPISSARSEVSSAAERFSRAAEEARAITGEFRNGTTTGHEGWEAIVKPEPMGTVLCISPYNYPVATVALQVAPALAAGNSVLLKPSSKTPISASILIDIITSVDLPERAINFIPCPGSVLGEVIKNDDRINVIAMTGSTSAGKQIASNSNITKLHMELGGNAPVIVFPDTDIPTAATECTNGAFKYSGQRCSAVSRVLVHKDVYKQFIECVRREIDMWETGDLFDEETKISPLISEEEAIRVESLINETIEDGATLVTGGDRDGIYVSPTLLRDVSSSARIMREEHFGPVMPVAPFTNREEALEIANSGSLSLDAAVYTETYDRALTTVDALDAGAVRINGTPSHGLGDIPFGGNQESGIGREGLHTTIQEMTRTKSVIL